MGVNSIVELSRRSIRGTKTDMFKSKKDHNKFKFSSCLLCLCSSRTREAEVAHNQKNNPPSLGQFLPLKEELLMEIENATETIIFLALMMR